ncbi:MAG: calcium-binding protein [Polymorphobacter sp.]
MANYSGTNDDDTIIGSALGDVMLGNGGNDILFGLGGNDLLDGGEGDDVFLAGLGTGTDRIDGGAGHDVVMATADNAVIGLAALAGIEAIDAGGFAGVRLLGSTGADHLDFAAVAVTGIAAIEGGVGNDTIIGSNGADRIIGGAGADLLFGGDGSDSFVYASTADSGVGTSRGDIIGDFISGVDSLDLTGIDADASVAGDQAFTFIGNAAFTGLGQLRIGVDAQGNTALFGNTTGSLAPDFQISFGNNVPLQPADLLL